MYVAGTAGKNACRVCDKTVYPMEQVEFEGVKFHKRYVHACVCMLACVDAVMVGCRCFVCTECQKPLLGGTYAVQQGKPYCKQHKNPLL